MSKLNFIKRYQNTCFTISFEGHIWHPDVHPGDDGPYASESDKESSNNTTVSLVNNPSFRSSLKLLLSIIAGPRKKGIHRKQGQYGNFF